MHLVFLAHRIPWPPNKGEKIRTYHQLAYLCNAGHRVSVLCLIDNDADAAGREALSERHGASVSVFRVTQLWWRFLNSLAGHRPLSIGRFYCAALQSAFDRLLVDDSPDAVLCTSSAMAEYVTRSKHLAPAAAGQQHPGPRLIMDFMDLDSDKWQQYAQHRSFPISLIYAREARLLAREERRIVARFDSALFISAREAELFDSRVDAPRSTSIQVIGNGVDLEQFPFAPERVPGITPMLLFTGVMDYFPNVDAMTWFVTDIWPLIRQRWPDARLVIAGMRPVDAVTALARQPGVEVTGFVDDVLPFYHEAVAFVAPFRLARGVQNKLLQAFATGVPVISTSNGAEGIDYRHGQNLLIADDADGFAAAVNLLLKDARLRMRLRDAARELVRRDHVWDAHNRVLEQLLVGEKETGKHADAAA